MYCACGKVVDEFETSCHWCGKPLTEKEREWIEFNEDSDRKPAAGGERQLELF
jgi:hypothetical protein